MIKTKECIHCETFFDCKGKPTRNPCLNFKERRKENSGFDKMLDAEMEKLKHGENQQ